jgi:hypothetical protein
MTNDYGLMPEDGGLVTRDQGRRLTSGREWAGIGQKPAVELRLPEAGRTTVTTVWRQTATGPREAGTNNPPAAKSGGVGRSDGELSSTGA